MSLHLVLARLTGEDDDEGETEVIDNRVLDGASDLALVGTELDATGGGPMDGIEADGLADAGRKSVHV